MWNERTEYMKSVSRIAVNALNTMAMLWEQMEFETEEPIEAFFQNGFIIGMTRFDKTFEICYYNSAVGITCCCVSSFLKYKLKSPPQLSLIN